MTHLLSPPTTEEHDRRRAHLFALLLVAVVAIAKYVTGLTDGSKTYMVYMLAIAVSAKNKNGVRPHFFQLRRLFLTQGYLRARAR